LPNGGIMQNTKILSGKNSGSVGCIEHFCVSPLFRNFIHIFLPGKAL
jgi:hypothetical protein